MNKILYVIGSILAIYLMISGISQIFSGVSDSNEKNSINQQEFAIKNQGINTEKSLEQTESNKIQQCNPNWECGSWSECNSDGIQARICNDLNNCESDLNRPSESQSCIYKLSEPEITPIKIAEEWVKSLIKGSGSENVFNYLPQNVKDLYDSYDSWNDELYNMKYAWNIQGLYFTFIEVKNEVIEGDNASVEVKYRATGIVQKTTTQKYEFIKDSNEWKLKEYYELTI